MKLKYYLRGLATGIVITTLILTIANAGNKPLTDAQIRQRAAQLGMVESDAVKLSALQGSESAEPTETASQTASTEAPSAELSETDETTSSEAASTETTSTEASSAESSKESETASSETASTETASTEAASAELSKADGTTASTESAGAESSNPGDGSTPVVIEIYSGATSYTVSKDLAAAGLVEDAKEYDTYLCDNGFASKIHVGTYEILPGTGREEIARMIAY